MSFLSPIWFVFLAPWAVLLLWLLWGRRPRINVPFLPLWHGPIVAPAARRSLQWPPIAVVFALLAILLGILAATRPAINRTGSLDHPITIIVDRGLNMSARGEQDLRYREAFDDVLKTIGAFYGSTPCELITVPGNSRVPTKLSDCASMIRDLQPTALDTRSMLSAQIDGALARSSGPILLITDQPPVGMSGRVITIIPHSAVHDVSIALVSARDRPTPQVMVRVRNQSSIRRANLVISSDATRLEKMIDLPASGQIQDYFFDLPQLGTTILANLQVEDNLPFNNRAWLVRQGSSPRIEARASLSSELNRVIEVYQRARPASDDSAHLPIVTDLAQLPADSPAILVGQAQGAVVTGTIQVTAHPITDHVSWQQLPAPVVSRGDAPAGWTPLVIMGGRTLVAIRPSGPKQVWVGFESRDWPRTADFVVFWTNIFDWAGGGAESFVAESINQWTPQWKPLDPGSGEAGMVPGIYRRSDGTLHAFNAPDIPFMPPPQIDWRTRLSDLGKGYGRADLSVVPILAAIICLLLSAATWKRPRLREGEVPPEPSSAGSNMPTASNPVGKAHPARL